MMENATAAKAATYVFWDIKRFPVPPRFDAHLVRPCIKRFLKQHGYAGPLTIFAVGILTDVHDDTLRALSSTGISLVYETYGIRKKLILWMHDMIVQTPANIVVLSDKFTPPCERGYNILFPTILWEYSGAPEEVTCSETGESGSWYCYLCKDVRGQGFDSFTSHISSRLHARRRLNCLPVKNYIRAEKLEGEDMYPFDVVKRNQPEILDLPFHNNTLEDSYVIMIRDNMAVGNQPEGAAMAVTSVFWDINRFPVPSGFDASLVRPCIKLFLEKYGYFGPLTIHAVGILTDVHDDILQALSSTGISLHYAPYGPTDIILRWVIQNPPPANIVGLIDLRRICPLPKSGYNLLRPFSYCVPEVGTFLWESSVLAGALEEDTCSETGEWYCLICDVLGHGFESFTRHLSSREHILMRFDCLCSKDSSQTAEKLAGEDMYPFEMVVRNQPKRLHDARTKGG